MLKKLKYIRSYDYAATSWKAFFINRAASTLVYAVWTIGLVLGAVCVIILFILLQFHFGLI